MNKFYENFLTSVKCIVASITLNATSPDHELNVLLNDYSKKWLINDILITKINNFNILFENLEEFD